MNAEKHRCSKAVWHNYHSVQCTRNGTVQRGDMWYCRQHDPVAVAERDAKAAAKWRSIFEARKQKDEEYPLLLALKKECQEIMQRELVCPLCRGDVTPDGRLGHGPDCSVAAVFAKETP